MDHVTAIITQLAQGLFESLGSSLLRSLRGKGLVKSEPASRRGPGVNFGFQLRLLHRPTLPQDRPRQLAVYRIDLQAQRRRATRSV